MDANAAQAQPAQAQPVLTDDEKWRNMCISFGLNAEATAWLLADTGVNSPATLKEQFPLLTFEENWTLIAKNCLKSPVPDGDTAPIMPYKALKCFHALRLFVEYRDASGQDDNPGVICDSFQAAGVMLKWQGRLSEIKSFKGDSSRDEPIGTIKQLKSLTTGWYPFKELVKTKLSTVRNKQLGHRFTYLIREHETSTMTQIRADYPSMDDEIETCVDLDGPLFDADNKWFYAFLKGLVVEGDVYTYIQPFDKKQNGRKAWLALLDHAEGKVASANRVRAAYQKMQTSTYDGKSRRFTFQNYIRIHTECHNHIAESQTGETLTETKKVDDFLRGISDPSLEAAVAALRANDDKMSSFDKARDHLLSIWTMQQGTKGQGGYKISQVATASGGGGGGGKKSGKESSFQTRLAKAKKEVKDGTFKRADTDIWTSNAFAAERKIVQKKRASARKTSAAKVSAVKAAGADPKKLTSETQKEINKAVAGILAERGVGSLSTAPEPVVDTTPPAGPTVTFAAGTKEAYEEAKASSAGGQFGRHGNKKRTPAAPTVEQPRNCSSVSLASPPKKKIRPTLIDLTVSPDPAPTASDESMDPLIKDMDESAKRQEQARVNTIGRLMYANSLMQKCMDMEGPGWAKLQRYEQLLALGYTYKALTISRQNGTLGVDDPREQQVWARLDWMYKEMNKVAAAGEPQGAAHKAAWDSAVHMDVTIVQQTYEDAIKVLQNAHGCTTQDEIIMPKGLKLYHYPNPKPKVTPKAAPSPLIDTDEEVGDDTSDVHVSSSDDDASVSSEEFEFTGEEDDIKPAAAEAAMEE